MLLKKLLWTAAAAVVVGAPLVLGACTVGFTTADSNGGTSPPPLADYDAGFTEDDGGDAAVAPRDGGAVPYLGSPLCNWSNAHSACNPDMPATALACYAGAADAGASDGGAPTTTTYACHVSIGVQNGVSVTDQMCTPSGSGHDGDACRNGNDCSAGFECIGAGVCRHYCCDYRECDKMGKLTFCDVQTMTGGSSADTRVPVCMPVRSCKLLLPGYCDQGETCAPVRADGTTSCVAVGPAKVGEACDREHCGKDLACLGSPGNRTCYQLCHTDVQSGCPATKKCKTSSAQFVDPTIGVCQ